MIANNPHRCVIDRNSYYITIVSMCDPRGNELEQPYCHVLAEGDRLIDTRQPTKRSYAGAPGFVRPQWDGTVWVEGATTEEVAAWELEHPAPVKTSEAVRTRRDKLLAETDWTQVLDAPIDAVTREAYRAYRQALRDIPEQPEFPGEVVWPELPAVTKAAPDPVDAAFDELIGGESNA